MEAGGAFERAKGPALACGENRAPQDILALLRAGGLPECQETSHLSPVFPIDARRHMITAPILTFQKLTAWNASAA